MASTKPNKDGLLIPSIDAQTKLKEFFARVITEHSKYNDYFNKMEVIDTAYARYVTNTDPTTGIVTGEGIDAATQPVGVVNMPSTTPPVVVSQVDSMVAYLADVYLSGYPLFPVVSNPSNKKEAEQLEVMMDDHALLGGYARQILMFFKDGIKYNISALEADWTAIEQYSVSDTLLDPGTKVVKKDNKSYTKLKRLDMYNTIWDRTVAPGDISAEGDYAGYVTMLTRTKLKRMLNRLGNDNEVFNIKEAIASVGGESIYRQHPQISEYVSSRKPTSGMDWGRYITGASSKDSGIGTDNSELFTLYARIIPKDFGMVVPMENTPQIWKFLYVNQQVLVQAKRIISAYDYLPILFGQPIEDGLGYQTQSIAEANIPFQEAAKTLFNIRFNSARRAVSDRALYDPDLISQSDVNAPVPAAKIPVKTNRLDSGRRIVDAYHPIPFDPRGTDTAIQDGMMIVNFGKELSGLNSPMQGQFQKGNKSVQEWNDTMGGADARLRMPALTLEYQVFYPLKEIIKLNIFQYGQDAILTSQKSGESVEVSIANLKKKVLAFRIADGYTPKSKLASTDAITMLMQMATQSPVLQESMGPAMPQVFGHLAQLLGVRGLEEYLPNQQTAAANIQNARQMEGATGQEGMNSPGELGEGGGAV
jgi:hypothetical protein